MEINTIRRLGTVYPGMDFFSLRNMAVDYLQELAGEVWTDFNEHDPGITILDQLCYAVTDLSYRTNFEMGDLLAGQTEFTGPGKDTFFGLEAVMHCHPLSTTDWRKLLVDRVSKVRNAWVEAVPQAPSTPPGLFRIAVEVNESVKTEADREKIRNEVTAEFYKCRNISEDLQHVQVLRHRNIRVNASVEVDDYVNSEEILATIFFRLQVLLSHPIRLHTLTQLLDNGYSMEEIFDGPRLEHGFIITDELYPRITHLHYSRLIRVIQEVPGVKNVNNFSIEGGDDVAKVFRLGPDESPILSSTADEQGNFGIVLTKKRIPVVIENRTVDSIYLVLRLSQPKSYVPGQHEQVMRDFQVKLGRDRNVGFYRSIQYDFPPIYGIGAYGVGNDIPGEILNESSKGQPGSSSERRRALARQLKGYLHIFEQLLANHLRQLASVPELFSIDTNSKRSYFPALNLQIPEKELIECVAHQAEQHSAVQVERNAMREAGLMAKEGLCYEDALLHIMKQNDPFFDRRNAVLDHLLARFGVSIPAHTFEEVNWYFTSEEELREFILFTKAATLRVIPEITGRRGQAADLLKFNEVSSFEQLVQLRFGIVDAKNNYRFGFRRLARTVLKYGIKTANSVPTSEWISPDVIRKRQFERYDQPQTTADFQRHRSRKLVEQLQQGQLIPDYSMLHNGYVANNYSIGFETDGGDEREHTVVYRDPDWEVNRWKRVGRFPKRQQAVDAILDLCAFIRFLNIESEGLHMVEHLALFPNQDDLRFETQLLSSTGKPLLLCNRAFSDEQEAETVLQLLINCGREAENYFAEPASEHGRFVLHLYADDEVIAYSASTYGSERDARSAAERIAAECDQLEAGAAIAAKQVIFRSIHPMGELPPLSFYAFRVSVLLPNWTSRFGNSTFRSMMGMMLRTYAPAHIGIQECWLEPSDLAAAEHLLARWRKARANNDPTTSALAVELANLLYEFSKQSPS